MNGICIGLHGVTNYMRCCFQLKPENLLIGAIAISGKTKWEMLDSIVRKVFKVFIVLCLFWFNLYIIDLTFDQCM